MSSESPPHSKQPVKPIAPAVVRVLQVQPGYRHERGGLRRGIDFFRASRASAGFDVRVASLTGPALLKLVAWSDRGRETDKDAVDLYMLTTSCADAGNTDRIYDTHLHLLGAVG